MKQFMLDIAPLLGHSTARRAPAPKTNWTLEEHELFLEGTRLYGRNGFKRIAQHIGSRTDTQVGSHSQKYFEALEANFLNAFQRDVTDLVEEQAQWEAVLRAAVAAQIKEQCHLPQLQQILIFYKILNGIKTVNAHTNDCVLTTEFAKWFFSRRPDLARVVHSQLG